MLPAALKEGRKGKRERGTTKKCGPHVVLVDCRSRWTRVEFLCDGDPARPVVVVVVVVEHGRGARQGGGVHAGEVPRSCDNGLRQLRRRCRRQPDAVAQCDAHLSAWLLAAVPSQCLGFLVWLFCVFICFETTSFCPAYHPFTNHRLNFVLLMVLPCSRYPCLCVVCAVQILWWRSQEPVLCVFC